MHLITIVGPEYECTQNGNKMTACVKLCQMMYRGQHRKSHCVRCNDLHQEKAQVNKEMLVLHQEKFDKEIGHLG